MLLLDSLYINNSGGKVLLDYLITELESEKLSVYYLFDDRTKETFNLSSDASKRYVSATTINRLKFYLLNRKDFQKILCFANVPPPIRCDKAKVYTYFHNSLILNYPKDYPLRLKMYASLQRLFLRMVKNHTDYWIVQSFNIAKELSSKLNIKANKVIIIPFYLVNVKDVHNNKAISFIYPCTGSAHKNVDRLLTAWEQLYDEGQNPTLHLTLSNDWPRLINKVVKLNQKGLKIINHGIIPNKELMELYSQTKYMVYPSLAESFGLPLIEAAKSGCRIIASDLPFTFAVVQPSLTFNPYDVQSIKEAVICCLENEILPSKCIVNDEIQALINVIS